jgi:UDP-glucuronate decarboxylase
LPADDPKQRQPNIAKARELLGWQPKTDLREGLIKTISYFDELLRLNESPLPIAASRVR